MLCKCITSKNHELVNIIEQLNIQVNYLVCFHNLQESGKQFLIYSNKSKIYEVSDFILNSTFLRRFI